MVVLLIWEPQGDHRRKKSDKSHKNGGGVSQQKTKRPTRNMGVVKRNEVERRNYCRQVKRYWLWVQQNARKIHLCFIHDVTNSP